MLYRGAAIHFPTTFVDAYGSPVTPISAKIKVRFTKVDGGFDTKLLDLENGGDGTWDAVWDSSVAAPGTVEWSLLALDGVNAIVQDGDFYLRANNANPAIEPT